MADREATRQRVLQRLANLRRQQHAEDDNRAGKALGTGAKSWTAKPGHDDTATSDREFDDRDSADRRSDDRGHDDPGSDHPELNRPKLRPPELNRPKATDHPSSTDQSSDHRSFDHQGFDHRSFDDQHSIDHPAWTLTNIPTTVAELRARSGFTTALADDDLPPF